jgi:HlyD family secretion protein
MNDPLDERERNLLEALGADGEGRQHRRWWPVALAAAVVLVAGAVMLLFPGREDAVRFLSTPAGTGDLLVTVVATGTLQPVNQVDVGTEVSGTIRTVDVDYNDRVSKGQVLARLDTAELHAQVVQSEANLVAAQARVSLARATVEETAQKEKRCQVLAERQMCTQDELDTTKAAHLRAQAEVESAEAQVEVARATLDAQRTRLEKAEIRSPIDGLVLARKIEPGQTVAASLQTPVLFVLAEDLRDMELHVDVDEADVGLVQEGQSAQFTVDAYPDRSFPAEITQVRFAPQDESGVVTYETLLEVDNQDLLLRPGMTAVANITVAEQHDVLLVPNAALRFTPPAVGGTAADRGFLERLFPRPHRRGGSGGATTTPLSGPEHTLWILRDGIPEPVQVRTGLTDGARTEIVEGELANGDQVVLGLAQNSGR